ncbi:MarR family transcriptional regulator [Paenibacillus sp. FSL A5-0031]|uniref:winged helix-turn-helix transcriptional regulator n=1 Tax=unclassified Paenibacillus TaxID=185978 RepID=UPI00096EC26F|nr:helix-turn-helix domain-containing protein [Paenibacillus sp. FSL A5-0031]OME88252.1 MarR family transcriptional regulator [Paenibacillus sp. FSL A5-0031]
MDEREQLVLERGTYGIPCVIGKVLDIIGTKWTFLIIRDLLVEETMRFSELLKSLEGISPKTLSLRLKELEDQGIVSRTIYAEVPPRVEYTITEKGKRLEPIFIELKRFGLTL